MIKTLGLKIVKLKQNSTVSQNRKFTKNVVINYSPKHIKNTLVRETETKLGHDLGFLVPSPA